MTEEVIKREKHPARVAQDHKLAELTEKRKEKTLGNKEQSTVHPIVQPRVQSTEQSSVQSTEQLSVQSTV